jgi:ferritin
MMKPAVLDAFNKQINAEFYSHYLYLSMAAHFEAQAFPGIGSWMRLQAKEEASHAMKFFEHALERGAKPALAAIAAPPASWESAEAAFKAVCDHEAHVTSLIHAMVDLAIAEKDHASNAFLQYFVKEQVEEEASAGLILEQVKMAGGSKGSLMMIDHRLGKRAD